jgi:hypothetical protein
LTCEATHTTNETGLSFSLHNQDDGMMMMMMIMSGGGQLEKKGV